MTALKTWADVKKEINVADGYAVVIFTDSFEVEKYPILSDKTEKLLEEHLHDRLLDLRVFDESYEYRLFRGDAGSEFNSRIINDKNPRANEGLDAGDYFDDEQYLDIDTKASKEIFEKEKKVYATGGGKYSLPLPDMNDTKIRIRNYIAYEEDTGTAYIRDWRPAGFIIY